ncbi:MAG: hypothetical protein AAF668_13980 [Pseudomonadota bacterium]
MPVGGKVGEQTYSQQLGKGSTGSPVDLPRTCALGHVVKEMVVVATFYAAYDGVFAKQVTGEKN